jgi:hypothetical protein
MPTELLEAIQLPPQGGSTGFGQLDQTVQQFASLTGRQADSQTRGGSIGPPPKI